MIIKPVIPIVLMVIICIVLLVLKRRGIGPYIRQIFIVILLFVLNLRIMVPNGEVTIEERDMNMSVIFVIDDTISMVANDYDGKKTRLEGVNECTSHIIDQLVGAKFSVMTFNTSAKLNSPYTKDAQYTKSVIEAIYPMEEFYSRGTSLNTSKELLLEHLKYTREKTDGKIVVFFISDGEITKDEKLDSFKELKPYIDGGAVLGVGTEKGGTMALKDNYSDEYKVIQDWRGMSVKDAVSVLDEKNLKSIAGDLGISYVHMTSENSVDGVVTTIGSDVEMKPTEERIKDYVDIYYVFAIPLLLLLGFEYFAYRKNA